MCKELIFRFELETTKALAMPPHLNSAKDLNYFLLASTSNKFTRKAELLSSLAPRVTPYAYELQLIRKENVASAYHSLKSNSAENNCCLLCI